MSSPSPMSSPSRMSSPSPRLRRAASCLAAAAAALLVASPATADYNQVIAFRAATPKCEDNPTLRWVGRASGQTTALMSDLQVPVSFVGCFATQAECVRWLGHGIGLITGADRRELLQAALTSLAPQSTLAPASIGRPGSGCGVPPARRTG